MFEQVVDSFFSSKRNVPLSRLQRIAFKIRSRFIWRASRSRNARLTLISQFFPPDFAATGQLLDDLTQRFAARGQQVQVLTGMPAYAYNNSDAKRIEFHPNRCIRRTNASRLWPGQIRGRAINGIFFCLRIFNSSIEAVSDAHGGFPAIA